MKALIKIASQRGHIPALQSILFDNGRAYASNLDTQAEMAVSVQGLSAPIAVQCAVVKAAAGLGALAWEPSGHLNGIQAETTDPNEFPLFDLEGCELAADCEIKADDLAFVAKAMGKNDVRYYLNGLCLDFESGSLVATDGHRMHVVNSGTAVPVAPCEQERNQFIVPREVIDLALMEKAPVRFAFYMKADNAPFVVAVAGELKLTARCLDAKYPDYSKVHYPDADTRMRVDTKALAGALKTAKPILKVVNPKYRGIALSAGHIGFSDRAAAIPFTAAGDNKWLVGINLDYLADALPGFAGEIQVQQKITDDSRREAPVQIANGARLAVIMPMRL